MLNINNYVTKKISRRTYNNLILFRSFFRKYHGLNKIDKKLARHISNQSGFFIELGANDGISQSNTLYLERRMNWRGILIEPNPNLFALCKKTEKKYNHQRCLC